MQNGVTAAGDAALKTADRYGVAARQITPQGEAALKTSDAYARKAAAPATLRAYRSDWQHYKDLVCGMRFRADAQFARDGRRLSGQPGGNQGAHDHPAAVGGDRQDAQV